MFFCIPLLIAMLFFLVQRPVGWVESCRLQVWLEASLAVRLSSTWVVKIQSWPLQFPSSWRGCSSPALTQFGWCWQVRIIMIFNEKIDFKPLIIAGRALSGFCVGIASLSLPVYLGETVQPEVRGTLGLLPTAFGNIGILLCFVAGKYVNWSGLAFIGSVLPVPFLILTFLIPETPRWFVSRGREERARKALQWLRGKQADVEPELKGIVRSHCEAERHASKNAVFDLMKRSNLKPLMISLGLMFFQQLSGINAVIFYTVSIFKDAGSTIDENLCTIIVGVVNFGECCCCCCALLPDHALIYSRLFQVQHSWQQF
jgi:MFS family permease